MFAISVDSEKAIQNAINFSDVSDYLILDTSTTDVEGIGASGKIHDWNISRSIVQNVKTPVILAGGLSSANVVQAIKAVDPWGVDSNTATNVQGDKVRKDMERVSEFCDVIRSAAV